MPQKGRSLAKTLMRKVAALFVSGIAHIQACPGAALHSCMERAHTHTHLTKLPGPVKIFCVLAHLLLYGCQAAMEARELCVSGLHSGQTSKR
eukprot:scaffold111922_cov15-Tisochrysis_lutea.AAC.1